MAQLLAPTVPARAAIRSVTFFIRYAWAVLAYNVFVVQGGALVRASGSGAGCGNHWPLCDGRLTPAFQSVAQMIEFFHRTTSGIDALLVAVLIWLAWRTFPRGHAVRQAAALSGVFLVTEALIGAALVLGGWVEHNASIGRAIMLSIHQANTLTLLACMTLAVWWADHERTSPPPFMRPRVAVSLLALLVLGITGALTALADTLYPVNSFGQGLAQDLNAAANIYIRLRGIHPLLAIAVGIWLVYFATSGVARNRLGLRLAFGLCGIVAVQLLAGAINVMLAAPVWMQLVHLIVADALWITLLILCANLGDKRPPARSMALAKVS
jgi:heme A synthase